MTGVQTCALPISTWIGEGVHADVHRLRWLPAAGAGGTRLHVACDGGIFVSAAGGDLTTFAARNTGLGSTEAGYLDSHPTSDGPVLIGVHVDYRDNHKLFEMVHADSFH